MTTDTTTTSTSTTVEAQRPRIRAGAVVWGLFVSAAAIALLVIASDSAIRADVAEAVLALDPGGALALAVAGLGTIALLIGLVRVLDRR